MYISCILFLKKTESPYLVFQGEINCLDVRDWPCWE